MRPYLWDTACIWISKTYLRCHPYPPCAMPVEILAFKYNFLLSLCLSYSILLIFPDKEAFLLHRNSKSFFNFWLIPWVNVEALPTKHISKKTEVIERRGQIITFVLARHYDFSLRRR